MDLVFLIVIVGAMRRRGIARVEPTQHVVDHEYGRGSVSEEGPSESMYQRQRQ